MKLSPQASQEVKDYKLFEDLKDDTSLIGESFMIELRDDEGNTHLARVTLMRPKPDRVELSLDDETFVIDNGDMKNLLDVKRRKNKNVAGVAFVGKGEIPPGIPVVGEALVHDADMRKGLYKLYSRKKGEPPSLQVDADIPFRGREKIIFSAEEVRK